MKNGLWIGIFTALCAALIFVGVRFAKETGLLVKYPEPVYLSSEETELRPIYEQLSKKEQAVYEALLRGISAHDEKISLPYEISGDAYSKIYCILEKQEGQLFYIDSTYYTAEKIREAKIIYRDDKEKIPEMQSGLDMAVENALGGVTFAAGEYDAVMRIHDYLIDNCEYVIGDENGYSSTAYGCLVEKRANCEGYAKAFGLLASEVGIKNILVTGVTDKGENHAWNQVLVDGSWYNIDVTWDDIGVAGTAGRLYFLCNDMDFGRTHVPDDKYFEPFVCDDSKENFYVANNLLADSLEDADDILRREIREGNSEINIKFETDDVYNAFEQRYIAEEYIFEVIFEERWEYTKQMEVSVRENAQERCLSVYLK